MKLFTTVAGWTSWAIGHPYAFALSCLACIIWALSGPLFDYSDAWQLVINTGTTVLTFLMLFILQHTQNRDTAATQAKLDELIRATDKARDELMHAEEKTEEEVRRLRP
jgi:low affinity Fe/Cu permease